MRKLRDFLRLRDTFQKSVDHQAPGESEHVTENIAELDVGIFEDLLNTIALAGLFSNQLSAPPSQIPQATGLIRSCCLLPLLSRERRAGVLILGSSRERAFTEEDLAPRK